MTTSSPRSARPACGLGAGHPRRPARRSAGRTARHHVRVPAHLLPRPGGRAAVGCCSRPRKLRTATTSAAECCTDTPLGRHSLGGRLRPLYRAPDRAPRRSTLGRIATSKAGGGRLPRSPCPGLHPAAEEPPEERPAPLVCGTWRRAPWKPGVRMENRDSNGRSVGPVYKDGAVEDLPFTRERRFFPRVRVRPGLPLAPITPTPWPEKMANTAPSAFPPPPTQPPRPPPQQDSPGRRGEV
ncbi:hypothetical protein SATRM34S_06983 [Streptomyces atroolivaceus]